MTAALAVAGAAFCLLCNSAFADEIFLKNGDHITGKILSAAGGSIVVTPDFAKSTNLSIAQADIATFKTDAPLDIHLKDGTVIKQAAAQGPAGQISIAPGGALAPQPVAVASIDKINPPAVAWHGSVGVNGLFADSTTSTDQIGLSADAVRRTEKDRITVSAAYSYGEQTVSKVSTINAENWQVNAKYDMFFSPKWYGYVDAQAAADHVNFLKLRLTPGAGGGYQWIDTPTFHFNTEGGVSWIYEDYSTKPSATEDIALRAAYHVDKAFDGGRLTLFHNFEIIPSVQDTKEFLVNTDAGGRFSLTKTMFSEIKAKLNYDNNPAPGAQQTTTEVRIGVGLTY